MGWGECCSDFGDLDPVLIMLIKTDACANSVDPDEMAHQKLHCYSVTDFLLKPLFATMDMSKFRDGRFHVINSEGVVREKGQG